MTSLGLPPLVDVEVVAAARYAAVRSLARAIKDPDNRDAILTAAELMAPFVPGGAALVPAPPADPESPTAAATYLLAREITSLVADTHVETLVVRETPIMSSHKRRQLGLSTPTVREHLRTMLLVKAPPQGWKLVLIDNVITGGATLQAMQQLIGRPVYAVVLADASRRV